MRIAINCRSILLKNRTGIGRYTYHLLDSLGKIDEVNHYSLHTPKRLFDFKRRLPNFSQYKNFGINMDYWGQGTGKSDIYHLPSPDNIPAHEGKLIVTVHDLIYKTYPQSHTAQTIDLTEKYMQDITFRADHVICISESTRRDLHSYYDIPYEKTSVVYNGVDHQLFYLLSAQQRILAGEDLKKLGIDKPFLLYVGTIEPRKNLGGLLESFALLKSKRGFEGLLVVVGMKGWMMDHVTALVKKLGIEKDVIFTGFISDAQLGMLYNMAKVFIFPSFYEGFGFPIIEAFCCGAVVITSKNSSCAEIALDAALTIDPSDVGGMTRAIEQVLNDQSLNQGLRQKALRRSGLFSFEATAKKTLGIYQKI